MTEIDNGIFINTYVGQANDTSLKSIEELLKEIAFSPSIPKQLIPMMEFSELYNKYKNEKS